MVWCQEKAGLKDVSLSPKESHASGVWVAGVTDGEGHWTMLT